MVKQKIKGGRGGHGREKEPERWMGEQSIATGGNTKCYGYWLKEKIPASIKGGRF